MAPENPQNASEWMERQGWEENPFILKILPSTFVGYREQVRRLTNHIQEGHKFALVTGATGSGKTTLLSLLRERFSEECDVMYLAKPPEPEELVTILMDEYPLSLWDRILGRDVTIHSLSDYLDSRSSGRILLLIDEGHEANVKDLEWIRTVTDQVSDIQLILAGLPTLDEILRRELETLRRRVTTKVELVSLDEEDVTKLVRQRIESQGGEGMEPFTEEVIEAVYDRSGGFPREVLKMCDSLVNDAINQGKSEIDDPSVLSRDVEDVKDIREDDEGETGNVTSPRDFLRDLPYKQREIVKILSGEDNMYPSEIAEEMGVDGYKSKQHAVRSVNNILNRLLGDGYVERSSRGRGYVYRLVPRVKNLLIQS